MRQARTTARDESTVSESTGTRQARTDRRGFGGLDKLQQTTFQVKDNSEVIIFLEPENFSYALRHWVKYIDPDDPKKTTTRVEICLEDDCPLCDVGDRPKATAYFNVVDLTVPTKVLVWEATADPVKAIQKEYNKLAKRGLNLSDDNTYWVISKEKQSNGFYTYSVDRISEEELLTEWKGLKPINGAQRDALRHRAYDESYVEDQMKSAEELQEFVDSLPTSPAA